MATEKFTFKAGLFGIGLETYWQQFPGLKCKLQSNLNLISERICELGVEIVNLGLVDNPRMAMEAGHRFRQSDVDIIFLYVSTYALSATVLPVLQKAKVP